MTDVRQSSFKEEQISRTVLRARAVKRLVFWHFLSGRLPLYLVTEFPKSGATWYAKMLSACIDVPFPPALNSPKYQSMILRDTKLYNPAFKNISVVMRDGRDIMVSAYYHFLFPNEANAKFAIEERRQHLAFKDYDDIDANMPRFIRYMFEEFPRQGFTTRFSWSQFVDSWLGRDVPTVQYEQLLSDPVPHMRRMVEGLTGVAPDVEKVQNVAAAFSFKALTGRNAGDEAKNSFVRKGIAGDWKNHFSQESRELFRQYGGRQLIALGYEPSDEWVSGDSCGGGSEVVG